MPLRTRMVKKSSESNRAAANHRFSDDDLDRAMRPSEFYRPAGRGRALVYAAAVLGASMFVLSSWNGERRTAGYVGDHGSEDNLVDHPAAVVDSLSRPFSWDGDPYDWCDPEPQPSDDNSNSNSTSMATASATSLSSTTTGLFFVKIMKAASSTGAGITLRIAVNTYHRMKARHAPERGPERTPEEEEEEYFTVGGHGCKGCCHARYWHEKAHFSHYDRRDRRRSFLWSIVRDPAKRAVSHVFFKRVSREGMEPSDENLIGELRREKMRDFQVRYLETTTSSTSSSSPQEGQNGAEDGSAGRDSATAESSVRDIIRDYDFLAVAERMDESLVVLKMMLHLDFGDFLYLSSKVTGGDGGDAYDDGRSDGGCIKLEKAHVTEGVASFLSGEFQSLNRRDVLLYNAVNRSLDLTIDRLGRTNFETQLNRYRHFLETVRNLCEGAAVFPCSSEGVLRRNESDANCYFNDWGCGYPCIDKFIVDYAAGRYGNDNDGDVT